MNLALLLIVALAPLPFGSNRPWAWSLLALVTGGLLLLWAWRLWRSGAAPAAAGPVRGPALLFLLVCAFAAFQAVPGLPPWLAHPSWRLPADLLGVSPWNSISIDPTTTLTAVMRLLTYGGLFWLTLQTFRTIEQADRALLTIALTAAAYAAYGVLMQVSGAQLILWYPKWAHIDSVTGTFPNRNHFATFTGLGLLCALAYGARQLSVAGQRRRGLSGLFLHPRPAHFAILATVTIDLGALVMSLSRAGLASTLLACVAFLAGLALRARRQRTIWTALLLGFFALAGIYIVIGGTGLLARLSLLLDSETAEDRFPAYRMMLRAIADHPWLGAGYGTFEDAFKAYRAPPLVHYFDAAHSTYLEQAIELGLPAAIALWLAVAWLGLIALRGFLQRRPAGIYGWAAACATLLVGFHAALDFSLQIPAVAIAYGAMLAIGCSQPASSAAPIRRRRQGPPVGDPGYFESAT
jgi:O-antigen ligase